MEFIRTPTYLKALKRMRVTPDERSKLEQSIANDPMAGDLMEGLKGLRKTRFGFGGRGKRGGGRAVYYVMIAVDAVIMLLAYAKNDQEDAGAAPRGASLDEGVEG